MFRNGFLPNNYIPRLGGYFNYCIKASIMFLILICLEIPYDYFVSFVVLMENSSIVLSFIILLNNVFCLIILQLEIWRILNIISRPKTNCPGINFSLVCYVLCIPYSAEYINPVQSNSKSSVSSHTLVRTMFANV